MQKMSGEDLDNLSEYFQDMSRVIARIPDEIDASLRPKNVRYEGPSVKPHKIAAAKKRHAARKRNKRNK